MGCSIVRFRFAPLTIALSGVEGHGSYFTILNLQISYLWYPTFDGTWAHHAPPPVYLSLRRFFYEYNTLYPATVPVAGQGPGFCLRKNFHLKTAVRLLPAGCVDQNCPGATGEPLNQFEPLRRSLVGIPERPSGDGCRPRHRY